VVGKKRVHIMAYDPRRPHAERYAQDAPACGKKLLKRMEQDALKLCRGLGYEMNTVEFAVENEIPYAIDFMNPVPDADPLSVGQTNFEWFIKEVADLVIARTKGAPHKPELHWAAMLGEDAATASHAGKPTVKSKPAADAIKAKKKETPTKTKK
jgi:hypothetical protein